VLRRDARWTTFDGRTVVSGPTEIRDYVNGLHQNMPDIQTRPRTYGAETAYVEGDTQGSAQFKH
jgi:hypothetical protein